MFLSDNHLIRFILWGVLIISAVYGLLYVILSRGGKDPRNILPIDFANRIRIPLILLLVAALGKTAFTSGLFRIDRIGKWVSQLSTLGLIFSITWFLIIMLRVIKKDRKSTRLNSSHVAIS